MSERIDRLFNFFFTLLVILEAPFNVRGSGEEEVRQSMPALMITAEKYAINRSVNITTEKYAISRSVNGRLSLDQNQRRKCT